MILDTQTPIKQTPDHVSCQLDKQLVILNTKSGSYFQINSVGADIWKKIGESKTPNTILEELKQEYEGNSDRIQSEALDFIQTLSQKNLISTL